MEREFFLWIMGAIGSGVTTMVGLTIYLHKDNMRQLDSINRRIDSTERKTDEIVSRMDRLFDQISLRTDALYEMFCDLIKETKTK